MSSTQKVTAVPLQMQGSHQEEWAQGFSPGQDSGQYSHIRTIRGAAEFFKANDPGTCLTETTIRTLVRSGKVASTKVGNRYLISIESLNMYLQGKTAESGVKPKQKTHWHVA